MNSLRLRLISAAASSAGLILLGACLARAEFNGPLVQCSLVTVPAVVANCGSDPLGSGSASVNNQGDVDVAVHGAGASEQYSVTFVSPDGLSSASGGQFTTDNKGNGRMQKNVAFPLGKVGAGNLYVSRGGQTQYLTGLSIEPQNGNHAGPDFNAELQVCSDVDVPAALAGCGGDPLKSGRVHIDAPDGDLNIQIAGAAANQTYDAALVAADGTSLSLGNFGTNNKGVGQLRKSGAFAQGAIGSGTVILERSSSQQFLTGFSVTSKPSHSTQTLGQLVRCLDVTNPLLQTCGTDPLAFGSATVNKNGRLSVNINGALPSTAYTVAFRPLDNSGDVATGITLNTNTSGNAHGNTNLVPAGQVFSGSFVVQGGGLDQFVAGITSSK